MRVAAPGIIVKLWMIYQEDGIVVTGLTNLTVEGKDITGASVLTPQALTEIGSTGEYKYDWNTESIELETYVNIIFKKSGEILTDEQYYFDVQEDMDAQAF